MSFALLGSLYQHLLLLLPFASDSFNYDDPNQWFIDFPQCLGFRQSPIAITTHKTFLISLPPVLFGFYDVLLDELLKGRNNGHTVEFEVPDTVLGERPFITGGLLRDTYAAEMVHFHWGSPQHKGSEHVLNGRRYDLEMHIVHRNTKYVNIAQARDFDDGLAVIAVLFKVARYSEVYYPGLNEVYNTLEYLTEFNTTVSTTQLLTLGSLLGDINRADVYTYRGSLTTPPCSESVTWLVFPQVLPIPHTELPKFWNILDRRGRLLRNNIRPLQSSAYHSVYHSIPTFNYLF